MNESMLKKVMKIQCGDFLLMKGYDVIEILF